MTDNKEIHKTEYIDKSLPTVYYEMFDMKSMTEYKRCVIQVSDKSADDAYKVFIKIKKEK